MYKLFMAFRYLRAHKIIYFSIVGVAFGIMTMVLVTSIMGGFSRDMRERIRGMQSEIVVQSSARDLWIKDYDAVCAEIRKIPHVKSCAPRIEYEAWMGQSGNFRDVHLVAIDPKQERGTSELERYFQQGTKKVFDFRHDDGSEPKKPGIVLGAEMYEGRTLGLTTARQDPMPLMLTKDFEAVGRFRSGMAEYDSSYVFMDLATAQQFLKVDAPPRVNVLAVSVDDYEANGQAARGAILDALHARRPCRNPEDHHRVNVYRCGIFRAMTWEQAKSILLQAVEVEKGIQIIIMFLIVLVAGFNIIAIYTLVVRAKVRDIGILRALGATEKGVISIFLTSGGLCGLIGSIFGIALGLLLAYNLNEIADFIRIFSREINRMSFDPSLKPDRDPRVMAWVAAFAALGAGILVVWNWLALYKPRLPHPWARMIAAALGLGLATWLCIGWIPGYQLLHRYDFPIDAASRGSFLLKLVGLWVVFCVVWRLLDRYRRRPGWVFFGFASTMFMSALVLAITAVTLIAGGVALARPGPAWPGLELFSSAIYYLDRLPVFVDYGTLSFIVAATLVVSVIFSIYPALRAASANPIEAIRDE